jgi:hypothetical protein
MKITVAVAGFGKAAQTCVYIKEFIRENGAPALAARKTQSPRKKTPISLFSIVDTRMQPPVL